MDPGAPASIAARLRFELRQMDRVVERLAERLREAESSSARDSALTAAALDMHGWYSGLERVFENVARQLDEALPSGPSWHVDLLRQMMVPLRRLRPAVLDDGTGNAVMEYLKFRHAVRSVYGFELDLDRVALLARKLPEVHRAAAVQVMNFAEFLESS